MKFSLKCFCGLKIALFGFEKDEKKTLEKTIIKNDGEVCLTFEESDVIIIKDGLILTNADLVLISEYEKKLVIEQWIYDSCNQSKHIPISNSDYRFKNDMLKKKFKTIETDILEYQNSNQELGIFNGLIFFISNEFDQETKHILFKAISLGRGILYNKVNPLTTHIICNSDKDNYNNRSLSFGKFYNPTLVNPLWVLESLKNKQIQSPDNFRPISGFQTLVNESNPNARNNLILSTKIVSNTLKGVSFFIYPDLYTPEEYLQIKEKIIQHSGEVLEPKNNCLNDHTQIDKLIAKAKYIIMNDGYSQTLMTSLIERKREDQRLLSHRFIDMWIDKRSCDELLNENNLTVVPYHNRLPFEDFCKRKVVGFLYGFPMPQGNSLENLLELIGIRHDISKKTTHIIVKEDISNEKMEYFKKKYNKDILFVKFEWLVECVIEGCAVKEDNFLLNKTEEKKD